jgi:nitrile hydratase
VAALQDALTDKGHFHEDSVGGVNDWFEHEAGPMSGAKVVARAWTDPAYRERLLADGTAAIAELGISGPEGAHMVVVENTPEVHNVIVCTLCSCYPWPVLGAPAQLVQGRGLPIPGPTRTQSGAPGDGLRRS